MIGQASWDGRALPSKGIQSALAPRAGVGVRGRRDFALQRDFGQLNAVLACVSGACELFATQNRAVRRARAATAPSCPTKRLPHQCPSSLEAAH